MKKAETMKVDASSIALQASIARALTTVEKKAQPEAMKVPPLDMEKLQK